MTTISIQPANTATGEYDVNLPLPYPFHIDAETGEVGDQELWRGDPARLLGFQATADEQRVALFAREWAGEPQKAVGMFPVFLTNRGGMYSMTTPITSVTVQEG